VPPAARPQVAARLKLGARPNVKEFTPVGILGGLRRLNYDTDLEQLGLDEADLRAIGSENAGRLVPRLKA
jgi:hypothetical protein